MLDGDRRPRILLILRRFPWPMEHGMHLRHLNIIERLQDRFVFDLYCYAEQQEPPTELNAYFRQIIYDQRQANETGAGVKVRSRNDDRSSTQEIKRELEALLDGGQYDVAVTTIGTLRYLPRHPSIPVIGDMIDNDCLIIWRSLRYARNLFELYRRVRDFLVWAAYQRVFFRRLACVCYVSEVDAAFSKRISRYPNHEVIPNGVNTDFFTPAEQLSEPYSLVFEGNMDFEPNVDAARYLISEILPRIHNAIAGAHLYLVGNNPHPDIVAASSEHVTVTGYVQDIRPWLRRARVFACPMRIGAGIKNKVLQAWAMGIPVVATTKGTGGLRAIDGQNILVRDRPDDFAEAVVEILHDHQLARSIGEAGRRTAMRHYTWIQSANRFGEVLQRAMTVK